MSIEKERVEDLGKLILRKTELLAYKGAKLRLMQKSSEFIPTQIRQKEIDDATRISKR